MWNCRINTPFSLCSWAQGKLCCLVPVQSAWKELLQPESLSTSVKRCFVTTPQELIFKHPGSRLCNSGGFALIIYLNICATYSLEILPQWCSACLICQNFPKLEYGKNVMAFWGTSVLLIDMHVVSIFSEPSSIDGRWGKDSFSFLNNILLPFFSCFTSEGQSDIGLNMFPCFWKLIRATYLKLQQNQLQVVCPALVWD